MAFLVAAGAGPVSREQALQRLHQLSAARGPADLSGLAEVVLVMCSSRGGSSVFMELLRHHTGLLHLHGEINPALAMAGLLHPDSGTGSDALDDSHATPQAQRTIHRVLAQDAGHPVGWTDSIEAREALAAELCWRLSAQWPLSHFDMNQVRAAVSQAVMMAETSSDGSPTQRFHARLLLAIRAHHPEVNPWYYDLDPRLVQAWFPDMPVPTGPPSPLVIEEPPFVLTPPWAHAGPGDLSTKTLIFKTPSNSYRLPFLTALFPQARVRVLHLTRNPAAAINGLVDGWQYRGFHAHPMAAPLGIPELSEADRSWWKYDLPPGWKDWTDRSLVEVAGLQWSSAHQAILGALADRPVDTLRVRFEDVISEQRRQTFARICQWLGVPMAPSLDRVLTAGLPPIMSTARPRQRRWFARAEMLGPVLESTTVAQTATMLGYTDRAEWI
jgi:hypothetical protein